jgi:hypothetical protein
VSGDSAEWFKGPSSEAATADHKSALLLAAFTNGLQPGGFLARRQSVLVPLTGLAGDLRLVVLADAANSVVEENETNNVGLAEGTTLVPPQWSLHLPVAQVNENAGSVTALAPDGALHLPRLVGGQGRAARGRAG